MIQESRTQDTTTHPEIRPFRYSRRGFLATAIMIIVSCVGTEAPASAAYTAAATAPAMAATSRVQPRAPRRCRYLCAAAASHANRAPTMPMWRPEIAIR